MRKRIAILVAQIEENTQKRFIRAFMKEAYAHDYDICIFSMYQKFQETDLRNIGDFNIFTLVPFDKFDGIVVLADTIQTPGMEEILLKRVKENYHGPVVVVDKETDLFDYVLMDHYTPIVEIVNHLIEVHHLTDIAFLSGKKDHPHSVQRLNAYLDAMKAHNLPVDETLIDHENYWYDGGKRYMEKLLAMDRPLPQAIVCANDCMALGVAGRLEEEGIRIPEDIVVTGYDSVEEGRKSPVPLTSADIPAASCGIQCFYKLHTAMSGEPMPELDLKAEIIIGGSCGCTNFETQYTKISRDKWSTDHYTVSYFSDFNHLTEDLLSQIRYDKFFEVLARYSYQVRPFDHLWFCFNDNFTDPSAFIGINARRSGYAEKMHMVVKCGPDAKNDPAACVDLDRTFDTAELLPELWEERKEPTSFVFTPLFFENICFGYAVYNHGSSLDLYDETYRMWTRNITMGIEAFYRQKAMIQLIDQIKADQIRDKQTGQYNYQGFHNTLLELSKSEIGKGKTLGIIIFDLANLKGINESFGRSGGDNALKALSVFLSRHAKDNEVCGRLGSDEFLLGVIEDDCDVRYAEIEKQLEEEGLTFSDSAGKPQHAFAHHAMVTTTLGEQPDLDFLINQAINANNHKKLAERKKSVDLEEMSAEMAAQCRMVSYILENSLLTYVFQPIVKVSDGEIYGYEALMRYEEDRTISPAVILECAESMNRLYDIEKATFNGVLNYLETHEEEFHNHKIFINSLPAHQLEGEDGEKVRDRIADFPGRIVVEYTEGSEFADTALIKHHEAFNTLNIEVALDDYGSGYSNVNNLIRYTPKYVKIDRMLISNINESAQKRHFVLSIVEYAKKNNIQVLAEGVETLDELRTVISLGVDLIQGYYTGRPAKKPIESIDEDIRTQIKRFNYFTISG